MKHQPPGLVKAGTESDVIMMICTAGHVDHGKTKLVKLLTGCNTDRLKSEQERGLTIELGFAPCLLEGGLCVGIVDVPGHEKFIKNMVAGVSGIGMTILVVAANDGIMPQTIEHFQIMELLGVSHGMVALTKIDLVSEERISSVTEKIRDFLKGTFMEGAPIYPVSSQTFDGYSEFYDALVKQIKSLSRKHKSGIFRMPIAHVFTQKGFGVVTMGIPVDGTIKVGAQVEVVPGNQIGKVGAIQQFLNETPEGEYGQCLALNIPDFNKKLPIRGQVLCLPGYLEPVSSFHVMLRTIHGLQSPLRNAEEIKFHTGTIEEPGKIYLLEDEVLNEGETGLATVVLSNPVVAAAHDRFIIRRPSPATTVAGGEVLAVSHTTKKLRKKQVAEQLNTHSAFFRNVDLMSAEGLEKKIEYFLSREQKRDASVEEISKGSLLTMDVVKDCLSHLVENKKVLTLGTNYYIHSESYRSFLNEIEFWLQKVVSEEGIMSLTLNNLRKSFNLPVRLWKRIEKDLQDKGLVKRQGNRFVLQASEKKLKKGDLQLMTRIQNIYKETGFHSPRPDELPDKLQAPKQEIDLLLEYLYNQRKLIRLSKNVVLDYDSFKKAQDTVLNIIKEKGVLDSADFKVHIGSTRKYALAILDFLDSQRVTKRLGNDRRLTPDYQRNLL